MNESRPTRSMLISYYSSNLQGFLTGMGSLRQPGLVTDVTRKKKTKNKSTNLYYHLHDLPICLTYTYKYLVKNCGSSFERSIGI